MEMEKKYHLNNILMVRGDRSFSWVGLKNSTDYSVNKQPMLIHKVSSKKSQIIRKKIWYVILFPEWV